MKHRSLKTNASGYSDPTAFEAVVSADKMTHEEINTILEDIFDICKKHGVFIYGDICLVNRKTKRKGKKKLYYSEFLENH